MSYVYTIETASTLIFVMLWVPHI